MTVELAEWLTWLRQLPPGAAWAALGLASLIEYVFPPFPGDTIVLAGAVLVGVFGWPVLPVLTAVTAGAVLGSGIDFAVGRWLIRTGRVQRLPSRQRDAVERIAARFARHGAIYLALNRFVPGVRALFFVAAGLADLRWSQVLLWSTVSALAWNGALIALGVTMGANLEQIELWFGRYNLGVGALVTALGGLAVAALWRELRTAG